MGRDRRSFLLALTVFFSVRAASAEPRNQDEEQLSKWMKEGLIEKWYPDGHNSLFVRVTAKWTQLPIDRQTAMAEVAGMALLSTLQRRGAKLHGLMATYFTDDPEKPLGDAITHASGTVVTWEDWYRKQCSQSTHRDGG